MGSVNNTWGNVVKQCCLAQLYGKLFFSNWNDNFAGRLRIVFMVRFMARFVYLTFQLHHYSTLRQNPLSVMWFTIEPRNRSVRHKRDYGRAIIVCLQTYWPKRGQLCGNLGRLVPGISENVTKGRKVYSKQNEHVDRAPTNCYKQF